MTNNNSTNLDHFNHRVRRLFSNVHIIKIIKYDSYILIMNIHYPLLFCLLIKLFFRIGSGSARTLIYAS